MSVLTQKIRLGAPTSMYLDWNTSTPVELGASTGGAQLAYTATYLSVDIDQTIVPVTAYKTKEETIFSVSLVQESAQNLLIAFGLATDLLTTTVAGAVTTPTAPTVTVVGTAATTSYSYEIVAITPNGDSMPSTAGTTSTGNATLSATNYNALAWTPNAGAYLGQRVLRTVGGTSQGAIATVGPTASSFNDTGLVATSYTAAVANPTNSNQDKMVFGGRLSVPFHSFDWLVPKNDGTGNFWVGHLTKCFSCKAVTIDYKRDKVSEVSKVELMALGDMTQPPGYAIGYLAELY
jgi:hypothetical protein